MIGDRAPAEEIAELASADLLFEVPGALMVLPWIGEPKRGRRALADFVREQRERVQADAFRVDDILAGSDRAVILGELTSTIKATGKAVQTPFAIVLTVINGEISHFQMLEDSYATYVASH